MNHTITILLIASLLPSSLALNYTKGKQAAFKNPSSIINFDYVPFPQAPFTAIYYGGDSNVYVKNLLTSKQDEITLKDSDEAQTHKFGGSSIFIGGKLGKVYQYQWLKDEMQFNKSQKTLDSKNINLVVEAIALNEEENIIVIGTSSKSLYVYFADSTNVSIIQFGILIQAIEFEPDSNNFMVGGGGENDTRKLVYYQYHDVQKYTEKQLNIANIVRDFKYTNDAQQLQFRVGQFPNIQVYDANYDFLQSLNISQYSYKLRANKQFLIASTQSQANPPIMQIQGFQKQSDYTSIEPIQVASLSFAMSSIGDKLILQTTSDVFTQYQLCSDGKTYAEQNGCVDCDSGCTICYDSKYKCYQCAQGYYLQETACKACQIGCTICTSSTNCSSCQKGYYLNGQDCVPCQLGCLECTSDSDCSQCDKDGHFQNDSSVCKCMQHYFLKGRVCQSCSVGCLNCDNQTVCTVCDIPNNFELSGNICVCVERYGLNGENCEPCSDSNCINCKDNMSVCVQCDGSKNFTVKDEHCVCEDKFYQEGQDCKLCMRGCDICHQADICQTCDGNNHYNKTQSDTCKCQFEYYDDGNNCLKCSDQHCYVCDSGVDNCTQCLPDKKFKVINQTCKCGQRSFLNISKDDCQSCSLGCLQCNNAVVCQTCDKQNHFTKNSSDQCQCEQKYAYEDGQCLRCNDQNCLHCNQNRSICTMCDQANHFVVADNNTCECNASAGYNYSQPDNKCYCGDQTTYDAGKQCQACSSVMTGCYSCQNGSSCTKCYNGFNPVQDGCVCPDGEYAQNATTCTQCHIDHCQLCSSATYCTKCNEIDHWKDQQGKCQCQDEYYQIDDLCKICNIIGCKHCKSPQKCTQCQNHFVLKQDTCACEDGHYLNDTQCLSCSLGCQKCQNAKQCTGCYTDRHFRLNNAQCICQNAYYQDQQSCKKCNLGCLACQGFHRCNECDTELHFTLDDNGDCFCDSGYHLNEDQSACDADDSGGLSPVAIVGIVVGSVAVIGIGFAVYKLYIKKRHPLQSQGYDKVQE